jgi:hypothetical protein
MTQLLFSVTYKYLPLTNFLFRNPYKFHLSTLLFSFIYFVVIFLKSGFQYVNIRAYICLLVTVFSGRISLTPSFYCNLTPFS